MTNQIFWSTFDPSIATISNTDGARGVARGLAVGSTSAVAALPSNIRDTVVLTVSPPVVTSIALTPANPQVPAGRSVQLTAIGTLTDQSVAEVTRARSKRAKRAEPAPGCFRLGLGLGRALGLGRVTIGGPLNSRSSCR